MLLSTTLTLLPLLPAAPAFVIAQEGADAEVTAASAEETPASAEALRQRIKDMRMNLLLGGDQVRQAEREAIDFYGQKSRHVEARVDDVETELVEVRASYNVVLDRALSAAGTAEGDAALREAQPLRAKISQLESESKDLGERRERLSQLVDSVQDRDRERRRLVDQIESTSALPDEFGTPMMGIGLAPPPLPAEASAPLADDALLNDLMARDPRAAKALLFDADPVGYWDRFPLRPPVRELRSALRFPLPDPPRQR